MHQLIAWALKARAPGFRSCELSPLSITLVLQDVGLKMSASPGGHGIRQDDIILRMASIEPDTYFVQVTSPTLDEVNQNSWSQKAWVLVWPLPPGASLTASLSLSLPIWKMGPTWVSALGKMVTMICLQSLGPAATPRFPPQHGAASQTFLGPMGQSHPMSDLSGLQGTFKNTC